MRRRIKPHTFVPPIPELIFKINGTTSFTIPTDGTETYLYDVDWGDGNTSLAQTGNASHTYSDSTEKTITISGTFPKFYFNAVGVSRSYITEIVNWGSVGYSLLQNNAFNGCDNLTTLASDIEWMNSITDAPSMFLGCLNLTNLPSALTLQSLVNGGSMFNNCNSIHSIANFSLNNLTNGRRMFTNCAGLTTTLPEGNTLGLVTDGRQMFQNTLLTTMPSTITFASLTLGLAIFSSSSLSTSSYSQLLISINANNSNTGVLFESSSSYNSTAVSARNNLTTTKSWTINDAGLV